MLAVHPLAPRKSRLQLRLAGGEADWGEVRSAVQRLQEMPEPDVIQRYDRDGGYIETLVPKQGGEVYYRSCAKGYCRYSSDLWQAELYLDHLLAR